MSGRAWQIGDAFACATALLQAVAALAYAWRREWLTAATWSAFAAGTLLVLALSLRGRA